MLEIETKKKGAELTSIKFNGVERLHEVNSFWNEQSPILFPVVGKLKYGYTLINGQEYKIPFHGFAHLWISKKSINIHISLVPTRKL